MTVCIFAWTCNADVDGDRTLITIVFMEWIYKMENNKNVYSYVHNIFSQF
jgi:hypothetical protein